MSRIGTELHVDRLLEEFNCRGFFYEHSDKMLHSVISSFVLCFLLFLCYEQVVCLPLKDNKNTTRLLISRQNLLNETTSKKLVILSKRKKLTYDDLPDDGSLDEEFERLQAQQSEGM